MQEAVDHARSGNGPSLIETSTYRYRGHFEGDKQKYRTAEEIHAHKLHRDPIDRFEKLLLIEGTLTREEIDAVWEGVNDPDRRGHTLRHGGAAAAARRRAEGPVCQFIRRFF